MKGCIWVMGAFRSRGTARKALFSDRRIEGLKAAVVTSQINPRAATGAGYLGQEVAKRGLNQCKIP